MPAMMARTSGYLSIRKSRDVLLDSLWGYDYYGDTRTVDVHIRRLRTKIEEDPSNPQYIMTVRGKGYKFKNPGGES